jgi:electron transfer flavoprotein alpha subunit
MAGNDVVIVCEAGDGQTESANSRLFSVGNDLAKRWDGRLVCLLAGGSANAKADDASRHVDEVCVADLGPHPYNSFTHFLAVQTLLDEIKPRAVLFGHTFIGMDLASRIAAELGVSAASNCLAVLPERDVTYLVRPMYRGRILAKVEVKCSPIVATLQSGGDFALAADRQGLIRTVAVKVGPQAKVRPLRTIAPLRTDVDITKAEIVVSGGRGIGERQNYALVENLAEALGGVPACSRPLVDMGWLDTSYQVGMSGNTVKPKLYVACGISGAVEHLHGMKEAQVIVAINKDPDAPIFKVAHFGIVGDLNEFIPAFIERAKAANSAS